MEQRNLSKETRAINVVYRSKTRRQICEYIYGQTGCEKCRKGEFCSRDGNKWSCLSYNNIAQHLNHISWPSSRGNTRVWETKTVRDQITWGLRTLTDREKQQRSNTIDQQRDSDVVWDTHQITDGTQELVEILRQSFGSVLVPVGSDIDLM